MIRDDIKEIVALYKKEAGTPIYETAFETIITSTIPDKISSMQYIQKRQKQYLIKGYAGTSCTESMPWICVFDSSISKSMEFGYFVAYALDCLTGTLYATLNQGWMQYEKKYGKEKGLEILKESTAKAQKIVNEYSSDYSKQSLEIHDIAETAPIRAEGNICGKRYDIDTLPTDTLLKEDLRNLLKIYEHLKGAIGKNLFDVGYYDEEKFTEESLFQELSNDSEPQSFISSEKALRRDPLPRGDLSLYGRDPEVARKALENAGHKCEANNTHTTFLWKGTSWNYMEAHHLIPMERQGDFRMNIDVPENIISLCPSCHAKIHKARFSDKLRIIEQIYISRRKKLLDKGIDVSLETLLGYYR